VQGLPIIIYSYFIFKYVFILYFHIRSTYSKKEYVFILYVYFFHESVYSYLFLGSTYLYFSKNEICNILFSHKSISKLKSAIYTVVCARTFS